MTNRAERPGEWRPSSLALSNTTYNPDELKKSILTQNFLIPHQTVLYAGVNHCLLVSFLNKVLFVLIYLKF